MNLHQERVQVPKLIVLGIVKERQNRDPVLRLVAVRIVRVVHQYDVLQVPVGEDPQVLDKHPVIRLNAILPIYPIGDVLALRV